MNRHPLSRFFSHTPALPRPLEPGEGLSLIRRPNVSQPLPEANRSRIQAAAECYGWDKLYPFDPDDRTPFLPKDHPKEMNAAGNTAYLFQIGTTGESATPAYLSGFPDSVDTGTPAYLSHR